MVYINLDAFALTDSGLFAFRKRFFTEQSGGGNRTTSERPAVRAVPPLNQADQRRDASATLDFPNNWICSRGGNG